jgi:hypothetical protein
MWERPDASFLVFPSHTTRGSIKIGRGGQLFLVWRLSRARRNNSTITTASALRKFLNVVSGNSQLFEARASDEILCR